MERYRGVVFVAEDEDQIRELTQDLLEDAGYLVLTARDGEEAMARMRGISGRALAIIDVNMPYMGGLALIASMKKDTDLRRIPVVVTSGRPEPTGHGGDRFLRKPYAPQVLLSVVEELCR